MTKRSGTAQLFRKLVRGLKRIHCELVVGHCFVDYYGRFDGEYVCLDCGARLPSSKPSRKGRPMGNPHELKTWPFSFLAVLDGSKRFEVRKDDRGFLAGDWLQLNEYDPDTGTYTGRFLLRQVTYILRGGMFGIEDGYVVMSLAGEG